MSGPWGVHPNYPAACANTVGWEKKSPNSSSSFCLNGHRNKVLFSELSIVPLRKSQPLWRMLILIQQLGESTSTLPASTGQQRQVRGVEGRSPPPTRRHCRGKRGGHFNLKSGLGEGGWPVHLRTVRERVWKRACVRVPWEKMCAEIHLVQMILQLKWHCKVIIQLLIKVLLVTYVAAR